MKKHGEPYLNLPYFEAMRITFQNLQDVADEVAEGTFEFANPKSDVAGAGDGSKSGGTVTLTALDEVVESSKEKKKDR